MEFEFNYKGIIDGIGNLGFKKDFDRTIAESVGGRRPLTELEFDPSLGIKS